MAEAREKRAEARKLLTSAIAPKEHRNDKAAEQKKLLSNTFELVAANRYKLKAKKVTAETDQRI
ncbi:hypothetical protein [Colwellia sp. MT2012]|uniref:hypothetical protein n=1 Tax=Colwellia sp. MT2012 TaxID=1718921 RepID=UPI003FA4C512